MTKYEILDLYVTKDLPVAVRDKDQEGNIEWGCEWIHAINSDEWVEWGKANYEKEWVCASSHC